MPTSVHNINFQNFMFKKTKIFPLAAFLSNYINLNVYNVYFILTKTLHFSALCTERVHKS